jgi:hypothetical protein
VSDANLIHRASQKRPQLLARFEKRRIKYRPEMNDPSKQDKPENRSKTKLDNRHQQSALKQLSQAGDKETAECGENVTR